MSDAESNGPASTRRGGASKSDPRRRSRSTRDEELVEVGERETLCDAIDRLLNRGAVVAGQVMITVADVDLIYLDLRLVLTAVDNVRPGDGNDPALSAPDKQGANP